jgi:hypothetical protein
MELGGLKNLMKVAKLVLLLSVEMVLLNAVKLRAGVCNAQHE